MVGRTPESRLGKHIRIEFPEGVGQPFHLAYERAIATQQPIYLEEYYAPWDRWFENRIFPSPHGLTIFFHLIVDDEDLLAQLLGELLRSHGYRVTVFSDSLKALDQFCTAPDAFDAVVSDQTMPGLTGSEFTQALRELRPQLPIILCSGFSTALDTKTAASLNVALLYKPVPFKSLLFTLEKLLRAARSSSAKLH